MGFQLGSEDKLAYKSTHACLEQQHREVIDLKVLYTDTLINVRVAEWGVSPLCYKYLYMECSAPVYAVAANLLLWVTSATRLLSGAKFLALLTIYALHIVRYLIIIVKNVNICI